MYMHVVDLFSGYYIARPYNFYLCPLSIKKSKDDKLEFSLDRTFAFSSDACDFLKTHHFDFGKMFSDGIHYLSAQEQVEAVHEWEDRANAREQIADIVISANDAPAQKFYRNCRNKIQTWVTDESVSCQHKHS